jgi:4-hydroxy-4-methyl-2-oxoglutarate aldolase
MENPNLTNEPLRAGTYSALVSDALEELGLRSQVMDPGVQPLTADTVLAGVAFPIAVEDADEVLTPESPYESEMEAIMAVEAGAVTVYSVPEGNRAAVCGELFAHAARSRGAVGAVVDGSVRDTRQLRALGYPVFSRGASPLDTRARARVREFGAPVVAGGVEVNPGDFVVGDSDGVVVVPVAALADVRELIARRERDEDGARADLVAGLGMQAVWDKWRVF